MHKNIGENSLKKIFELIEEKIDYLKGLINGGHSHSYNDLSNKPTIPSSLPANGGNADTVDGKHVVVTSSAPTNNDTSIVTIVI